jgi:hypothetical protein
VRHLRALGEKTKNDLAVGAQAAETISRRASILRAQAGSYTPRDAVLRRHACWACEVPRWCCSLGGLAARSDVEFSCAEASGGGSEQQVAAKGQKDWQNLAEKVFEQDDRPIILYDGVCNLCNGGVNFMLDWDSPNEERGRFRFAALQSNVGRALLQRSGRRPDDCNSIILALKDGNTYAKGEAVLRIGQVTLRICEEENIF